MRITTKTTNYTLTPEIGLLIEDKLGSLGRFLPQHKETALMALEVAYTTDGKKMGKPYRAEVNLDVNGTLYRAEASADTMESAVEAVRNELRKELGRSRGRARELFRRGGSAVKSFLRFSR
ncbi:MAG: HPF/RaiA family ribosome-associated protein [Patescibacteria group bacterium]|nr:HPF/RaiA family ribosome-associated protein [Patescibacteria group bacterium]